MASGGLASSVQPKQFKITEFCFSDSDIDFSVLIDNLDQNFYPIPKFGSDNNQVATG